MGITLRFDDTLETVLGADLSTAFGVESVWRQLVDLIGRRRVSPDLRAMALLAAIRAQVPVRIRAGSAQALEYADPPVPLVRLFALDELIVAIPVLRGARMTSHEWIELLPDLAPAARTVLRSRRDLGPTVIRALQSFGAVDFVLPDRSGAGAAQGVMQPVDEPVRASAQREDDPIAHAAEQGHTPVMEHAERIAAEGPGEALGQRTEDEGPFEIAEVVARIDAFWRNREEAPPAALAPDRAREFRFETDADGLIRWVDGASRGAIVGLSLGVAEAAGASRVDGIPGGALRRRASFSDARLVIAGESDAAGDWLISAIPVFDPANGRFTGYRGTARRPRTYERAELVRPAAASSPADSLRQLVHELRTPTNAIAGFAEMIETQMLGPVSDPYRERAHVIRTQAKELLGAIDDLDLAARIDSAALALVPGRVALRPLLAGIADDLASLAELRGSTIEAPAEDLAVSGDRRAVERLLARLLATLVSASAPGERIGVRMALESEDKVAISIDRPKALADYPGESVLGIDDEHDDATLLGTGFALRLARNLARELGGGLVIGPASLTLRLPASVNTQMGQAHLS